MNHYEITSYNPLSSNFVIPSSFEPIRRYAPEEVLSADAIAKFNQTGLTMREVQMFTTPPCKITGIHIDGDVISNKAAVNYVTGSIGIMKWYEYLKEELTRHRTPAGTDYILLSPEDCREIDSLALTKLTLVQVCVPHNIVNMSNSYRYCFSIRFHEAYTFEEMLEIMKGISW